MKNKNKLLSLLLCFALVLTSLLSCFSVPVVYAATIELYEEDYENAYRVLDAICPGIPLLESESVTRADFVAAVTMMLGMNVTTGVKTEFSDVSADHKYSGNINNAVDMGLISKAQSFSPDAPITYNQAVKILMCATGHGKKADFLGGYPTGYVKVAKEANVGENTTASGDDTINSQEAAELILEAVCTDMLEATSFGDDFEYSQIEGRNILSVYHKIYIAKGITSANKLTGLYSVSGNMDTKGISINGKEYFGDGYNNLLGKNTRVFFMGEKKREIITAYAIETKSYTFTHEDSIKLSGNNAIVYCSDSDKEEKFGLDADYTFIYNGKYYPASESSYNAAVNPNTGMVEFIDNNANGKIDVISVKDIEYGVIDSVNIFEGKIYDRFKPNGMNVVSDDIDYAIVGSDGEPIELSELTKNTVVGYARSKDGKALEIIRFTEKTGGTYSELSEGEFLVLGEGKEVELSEYFKENIKEITDIKFGTRIIAYLGIGNQVVYIDEYASSISYGYLSDFANIGSGLNRYPCARIYSQEGEMLELKLAETLTYNGVSTTRQTAGEYLENLKTQPNTLRVIKYAVNANGELSKVYEAIENTAGITTIFGSEANESRPVLFDDNTSHGLTNRHGELYFDYGIFYPYFSLKAGASIMQIPALEENKEDEDFYNVYTQSTLTTWVRSNDEVVSCYGYDVTKDGASFVLWPVESASSTSVSEYTPSGVVESITTGVDEDGNVTKVLKMYVSGSWVRLNAPSEFGAGQENLKTALDNVQPGDIARVSYDNKNIITAMQIDFSYVNGKTRYAGKTGWGGGYATYAAGYAYSIADNKATIIQDKTIEEIQNETVAGTLGIDTIYPVNLASGTTVYVELNRNRTTGQVETAEVFTEANASNVESYFTAGLDADYIVSRSRFHAISISVVYVN